MIPIRGMITVAMIKIDERAGREGLLGRVDIGAWRRRGGGRRRSPGGSLDCLPPVLTWSVHAVPFQNRCSNRP